MINKWAYIRGGAYIWNEVSVSTCGGLIHGGGLYSGGGAYSRRFTVVQSRIPHLLLSSIDCGCL